MRILIVEPYYGGSHKNFLLGLQKYVPADYVVLSLPARKWKMRMQLSAPFFADQLSKDTSPYFNRVLCSTFVDVAVLRALLSRVEGWNRNCRFHIYFHENQFVYPDQVRDTAKHQFSSINFLSALASDRVAFNSRYNYRSFFAGSQKYIKKAADMNLHFGHKEIADKSSVLYPGLDFSDFLPRGKKKKGEPVIIWNHRWEHDKNPEDFFTALFQLVEDGYPFRLIVLGQHFGRYPKIFDEAKNKLHDRIVHFGYAETREMYVRYLHAGDIVVSTAFHEFFGIAVMEAVRAGCYPVVPDSLSYPELYPRECLYRPGAEALYKKLTILLKDFYRNSVKFPGIDTERYGWPSLAKDYYKWLVAD